MTWTSLMWRLGVLWRLHRRRARIAWYLWRRSRRPVRLPSLPSSDPRSSQYVPYMRQILNAEVGSPIRVHHDRMISNIRLAQEALQAQYDARRDTYHMHNRPDLLAALQDSQQRQEAGMRAMLNGAGGI